MSGFLDKKARATAEKLLKKFGKVANYSSKNDSTYNDATGETTEVAPTLYSITCYIDTQRTGELFAQGSIQNTETVILVSAKELTIEPKSGDDIVFSSASLSVKRFNAIWSGDKVAMYEIIGLL